MACKKCGSTATELYDKRVLCSKCGTWADATTIQSTDFIKGRSLAIALIGHGTYNHADGDFSIEKNTTIHFKVPHDKQAHGATKDLSYNHNETLRTGDRCHEYRLWPLTGENWSFNRTEAVPYHHAHHQPELFAGINFFFMFSGRSGDGPRLSSIIARIRLLQPDKNVPLEIIWLPCREVISDNYAQQDIRSFSGSSPIVVR